MLPNQDLIDAIKADPTNPERWKDLGKARGWGKRVVAFNSFVDGKEHDEPWKLDAMRWFETRLSNGDEIKFWESLP